MEFADKHHKPTKSHALCETHDSAYFSLTRIINIISGMSCCVAFIVNINSKILRSM